MNEPGLPPHSTSYIKLPAFAGVVSASILFAQLAHSLPDRLLKCIFVVFLFFLACHMAYELVIEA